jgi:hypothetical protein
MGMSNTKISSSARGVAVHLGRWSQAPSWREVAAERRRNWEARQPEYHGVDDHDPEWDDD